MAFSEAEKKKRHAARMRLYMKKPESMAKDRARHRARYAMDKKGKVRKHDGKDVDHKNGNATDNRPSNLRILSKSKNRSMNKK